jgi:hypothetical protein
VTFFADIAGNDPNPVSGNPGLGESDHGITSFEEIPADDGFQRLAWNQSAEWVTPTQRTTWTRSGVMA